MGFDYVLSYLDMQVNNILSELRQYTIPIIKVDLKWTHKKTTIALSTVQS